MLERPELRSRAARFPLFVFGVAPVLVWLGTSVAVKAALSSLPEASRRTLSDAAFVDAYYALCLVYMRLLPVLLGAVLLEVAARRRLRARSPLLGAGVIDVLAGTLTAYILPGQLGIMLQRLARRLWSSDKVTAAAG
jgi:hypothetical protein